MKFFTGDIIQFKGSHKMWPDATVRGRIVSLGLIGSECIYVGVRWGNADHISSFEGPFAEHFLELVERV